MAKGKRAVDIVRDIARPVREEMGLILWDVKFEKEGPDWVLTVLVDKEGGVNIQECEELSRAIDPLIDEADPISQSYYFSVSSAGLGRKLTKPFHFHQKMGEEVRVRLIRAVDGVKEVKGILTGYSDDDVITLTLEDGSLFTARYKDTAYTKLCDDEDLF